MESSPPTTVPSDTSAGTFRKKVASRTFTIALHHHLREAALRLG